jgi:hypothetical protein
MRVWPDGFVAKDVVGRFADPPEHALGNLRRGPNCVERAVEGRLEAPMQATALAPAQEGCGGERGGAARRCGSRAIYRWRK